MKARIVIEYFINPHNPHCRVYHTTSEVSQRSYVFERPLRDASEKYLAQIDEVGAQLVRELFAIAGVDQISISPYCAQISKGGAFEWNDIQEGIIGSLKKTFAHPDQVEVSDAKYDAPKCVKKRPDPDKIIPVNEQ